MDLELVVNQSIAYALSGLEPIWVQIQPWVFRLICASIVLMIIKSVMGHTVFDFCRASGDSVRVARRKAHRAEDIVDLISAANDLHGHIKK